MPSPFAPLMLTSMFPILTLILTHSLVSQLLQHLDLSLPCLLHPCSRTYYPLQGKYLRSRARLILFLLKERGKAINLPLVIVDPILQVLILTLLTSHRALSPSRTGLFAPISPVRVAVFMVITLTIVPYYHRCSRCGSLRLHYGDNIPPLLSLPMWLLINPSYLPILSLNKDSWLLKHLMPW